MNKFLVGVSSVMASAMLCLAMATPAFAGLPSSGPTPITIDGVVTEAGQPAVGEVVVGWCGDLSHFAGSDFSDGKGYFVIHTNSEDCPLGSDLSAVVYRNGDEVFGVGRATTHTQTTVNITVGEFNPVVVPEYGWATGLLSVIAGGFALNIARRRQ